LCGAGLSEGKERGMDINCDRCGCCCQRQGCNLKELFGIEKGLPCVALIFEDDTYSCGIISKPEEFISDEFINKEWPDIKERTWAKQFIAQNIGLFYFDGKCINPALKNTCHRCGKKATETWSICAMQNKPYYCCAECDIELNKLFLMYMKVDGWESRLKEYSKTKDKTHEG